MKLKYQLFFGFFSVQCLVSHHNYIILWVEVQSFGTEFGIEFFMRRIECVAGVLKCRRAQTKGKLSDWRLVEGLKKIPKPTFVPYGFKRLSELTLFILELV